MMKQFLIDRRWIYCIGLCLFLPIIYWCAFYLLHDHNFIGAWFLSLGEHPIVNEDRFLIDFFTVSVKTKGDTWCILGTVLAILSMIVIARRWKQNGKQVVIINIPSWSRQQVIYSISLLVITLVLWLWGNHKLSYQPDELYSANHIASMHPFQALSYYMDVNNHLLFNQVNSILFGWATDKTQTGRIISLFSYLSTTILVHHFIGLFIRNKVAAFCAAVLLIAHMTVWGWAISGRGYALYTMAAWLILWAMYHYYLQRKSVYLLLILCGTFIGYATLPTFLYFHPSIILTAIVIQAKKHKIDRRFWRYQLMAGVLVLLFYIPCISISGLAAITSNRHVPKPETYAILAWDMYRYFRYYLNTLFLGEPKHLLSVIYLLFLLPIVTILKKSNHSFQLGFYFVLLWSSVVAISLTIKTFTAPRTLSPQLHISFTLTLLTIYLLIDKALISIPEKRRNFIFSALCIVTAACLIADNSSHIALTLYGK